VFFFRLLVREEDVQKQNAGFTLIELLVVISIIALLMSMLMPALARVRKQAKAVVCQATLRQWGAAWEMYATDNNGYLWSWSLGWIEPLEPYYKDEKMLLCPSATKTLEEGARGAFVAWEEDTDSGRDVKGSYGPNAWTPLPDDEGQSASGGLSKWLWKTANVKGGNNIPMLLDCGIAGALPLMTDTPPTYDGEFWPSGDGGNIDEMRRFCVNRHSGYVNCLFLDWSVRKVGLRGLWYLKWNPVWEMEDPPVWPDWMADISNDH